MKPKLAQFLRVLSAVYLLLLVAVPLAITGFQELKDAEGERIVVPGADSLTGRQYPIGTYVTFPLRQEEISAVQAYQKQNGRVIRLKEAASIIIFCGQESYEKLTEQGNMRIDGRIVIALSGDFRGNLLAFAPGVESDSAVIIAHGMTKRSEQQAAWILFAVAVLALLMSLTLFRSYIQKRLRDHGAGKTGFFERLALSYPAVFEKLEKVKLNGTGISILDYHGKRADSSYLITKWLTLFYIMPIAPIRRERIIPGKRTFRIRIPFFWHSGTLEYERLERLSVDRRRTARVYLFYYLFVLPFSVGPLMGFLIWLGVSSARISAGRFWLIVGLLVIWGIFVFYLEERIMKRPR